MLLKSKTALITGVTRGIGRAIAECFADQGARLAGVYHSNGEQARQLETVLGQKGTPVKLYRGDVADHDFAIATIEDIIASYGDLDIIVNNAGLTSDGFAMTLSDEAWRKVFDTHFLGTYNFSVSAIPHFLRRGAGKVINVVSVTGVLGREGQINYGTAKGAIIGLTRLLARKYSPLGLAFNLVAPGMIETDMIGMLPADKVENFVHHTTMKRLGNAGEVANAVLFLASDLGSYMSTTALRVDGGFMR